MSNIVDRDIRKEINEKLGDDILRGALGRFAEAYPISRLKAYENVDDIEVLREAVKATKSKVVNNLEEVTTNFIQQAQKRGAHVFQAKDGAMVKEYIINLCREKNVKRIVKSKSMASEEIHLNDALISEGIHVKETDLGEWIISLAGHKPSHMVMPAIHLNKQQVANYFSKELDKTIEPDIANMVYEARQVLRDEFLNADMGITGANFGIAENGAIGLVTNEGNARLVTTIPRIHVVIMGYEKLLEKIVDAVPILRSLPRNATAQLMTSYMSMICGPTPTYIKKDGKWIKQEKELHIILLDNGRLKVAKDEKFKQVYQCVRCASCLNVCPVYTMVGGHVYGHIYAGGIGAILTAFFHSMGDFEKINELCIGCRSCTTVCPGKIPIPDLIEELRAEYVKSHGLPRPIKMLFENIISNRRAFHGLLRMATVGQAPFKSGSMIRHLPWVLSDLTKDRSLPTVASKPLRDILSKSTKQIDNPTMRVGFFSGCSLDFIYPNTGLSVVKVLQDLNIEVVYPEEQSCCGKPLLGMGDREASLKIAQRNIEAFEKANIDVIIAACPTCTETWHATYINLFENDIAWKKRAESLAHKVREFTSFVVEVYEKHNRLERLNNNGQNKKLVTYHDSCHMKRGLNIFEQPRKLISSSPKHELVEMKNSDKCCGMAGAFGVKYSQLSRPILAAKIENIKATNAEIVAVACPACMMQLKGGLDKQLPNVEVKHIADILAENIE